MKDESESGKVDEDDGNGNDDDDGDDDDDDDDDDDKNIWPATFSKGLRPTDSKRNGRNVRLLRSDERVGGIGSAEELMRLTSVR
jgi:hypothetical protein